MEDISLLKKSQLFAQRVAQHPAAVLVWLLLLAAIPYLPNINRFGLYWDDWGFNWMGHILGTDGLTRYFASDRPVWGNLFKLSTQVIGTSPFAWQLYEIFWRWVCAATLWWTVAGLTSPRSIMAAGTASLFLVYPGFGQNLIAICYSHFYIVLVLFFLSFGLMVKALEDSLQSWRSRLMQLFSLLFSAGNLFMMEYFFFLDLLRPFVLWVVAGKKHRQSGPRIRYTLFHSLPYLAVFGMALAWRLNRDNAAAHRYEMVGLTLLKTEPVAGVAAFLAAAWKDFVSTAAGAWNMVFQVPAMNEFGLRSLILFLAVVVLAGGISLFYLYFSRQLDLKSWKLRLQFGLWLLPVLLIAFMGASLPFWLADLPVRLNFPNDRFTISFALGSALLLGGILYLIPRKAGIPLLAILLAAAAGYQFQVATDYRRDWNVQVNYLQQMLWRIPSLERGTTLLANPIKGSFYSDSSMTAPLNWIYAPGNNSTELAFMYYYPEVRLGRGLVALEKGHDIDQNYRAASFKGNTSAVIAVYYEPPSCLRVLDPELDPWNPLLDPLMREAAALSVPDLILPQGMAYDDEVIKIIGEGERNSWCFHFQKAQLAAQQQDWQEVARLGNKAFGLDDYPNDPAERLVFIEGYAHTGEWEKALELTRKTVGISPKMKPVVCRLWHRIQDSTAESIAGVTATDEALLLAGCR